MKAMLAVLLLVPLMFDPVLGQNPTLEGSDADWEQAVRTAEQRHVAAALSNDASEWEPWLSDEFVVNSPLNTIVDKPALLDFIRGGVLAASSFGQRIELVRRLGGIVVVMGEDSVTWAPPSPNAGRTDRRRFTDVWRLEDGDWRLVARQATLLPDPSDPEGAP